MSSDFTLVYGTNFWSHHQAPLVTELAGILGNEHFKMVLFDEVAEERRKMGWGEHRDCPWLLGPPRNEDDKERIMQQCLEADVMVFGACPMEVLSARLAAGKLTFVASERILKKGFHWLRMINPRYAHGIRRFRALVNHPQAHALAVGYHAPEDLRTIGSFAGRIWKWGYFVDVNSTPPRMTPERPIKVLWVGRMLHWKRVDVLLRALAKLQHSPLFGECIIVGDGPEKKYLLRLARRLRLNPERIIFKPSVSFDAVRLMMQDADVYVLPSNRHEGWGAVAGEAMSEGCVLIANEEAGAAKDLIVEGETGFLFRDGDVSQLLSLLERVASDRPLRLKVRHQAWEQMNSLWHPRVAAERLVALCHGLLGNAKQPDFVTGPCRKG